MPSITSDDRDALAVGAALHGSGGGGDPYISKLMARDAIERYGPVALMPLTEVPDDFHVVACGNMGAPTILLDKLPSGDKLEQALHRIELYNYLSL